MRDIVRAKLDLAWTKVFFDKDFAMTLKKSKLSEDAISAVLGNTQLMKTIRQQDEGISELNQSKLEMVNQSAIDSQHHIDDFEVSPKNIPLKSVYREKD